MKFTEMRTLMLDHFETMLEGYSPLFEVNLDKDKLWELYLESFPKEKNPIFRQRREHDCSCCRHFIKSLGNVVTIKNGEVISLWDFDIDKDDTYGPSIRAMREYVHSCNIANPFFTKEKYIGTKQNREFTEDKNIITWDHFYANVPDKFVVNNSYFGKSKETLQGEIRDTRNVFKRSLEEITEEAVNIVLELIAQGSLYRGEEHKAILEEFSNHQKLYNSLTDKQKELYTWEKSNKVGIAIGRIRNHAIGTLLVDISKGVNLDTAVKSYERIVAPANYKRPKPIFTKRMLEDAKKTISDLGYMESLQRRYAVLEDITVNNILFCNKDSAKRIKGSDVFDALEASVTIDPKRFNKVEEVTIDNFINNILPTTTDLEILFENKLVSNMVSLIAPYNKDSKTMFKWNNNFCWAYTGNIADSMKERVKAHGGNVEGDLRFSIQWNEDGKDNCDLDAHCVEPNNNEIYFGNCKKPGKSFLGGQLDVDIIDPKGDIAVENITYNDRHRMMEGVYKFYVHQYSGSVKQGFRAEIEFDGQIYYFDYTHSMRPNEYIEVAEVTLKNGSFTVRPMLPTNSISSREVWNLSTNQFVPVSVVMYSPNYWDEQNGIGNKHYFFMLKDCINPETPNGFYNEYLNNELDKHKRVMEALGSKLAVTNAEDQLSGIGFSSTKRNSIVVKVKGQIERTLRVTF